MEKEMPKSVGFIVDGNRRWARAKNLPTLEGHKKGYENLREIAKAAFEMGIEYLTFYVFSTENWNRSKEEVEYLIELFEEILIREVKEMEEEVRFKFIGQRERFSEKIQKGMKELEERTKNNTKTIVLAVSYGGRAEIVEAVNKAIAEGKKNLTEEAFGSLLWSSGIPDPDLIIRTSGEQRLSGFLTWQSVYSEFAFPKTHWPDFTKGEFVGIIDEYRGRERRLGR